jgi:hypothetical protein
MIMISYLYICITVGDLTEWRIDIPLNGINSPHVCACPKPGHVFVSVIIILRVSFCSDVWYCNILAYYLGNILAYYMDN